MVSQLWLSDSHSPLPRSLGHSLGLPPPQADPRLPTVSGKLLRFETHISWAKKSSRYKGDLQTYKPEKGRSSRSGVTPGRAKKSFS